MLTQKDAALGALERIDIVELCCHCDSRTVTFDAPSAVVIPIVHRIAEVVGQGGAL